jgi:hypothetical protein
VRAFAALPESPALAAANKRISNILKKTDDVELRVTALETAGEVLVAQGAERRRIVGASKGFILAAVVVVNAAFAIITFVVGK